MSQDDGEEMSIRESYAAQKEISREKRAGNREQSTQFLDERGIEYTECNHGAHLIVKGKIKHGTIDFWPGTGRFIGRDDKRCDGRGVRNLIKYCDVIGIIRPEVMKFAKAMEAKLRENDHKGGWDKIDNGELFCALRIETSSLYSEIQAIPLDEDKIKKECADVANYAMMIFDNCEN